MKNKAFEINEYGTHIFDIKTLIPEGLDIEVNIEEIKGGTRDFKNDLIRFDHFLISTNEKQPITFKQYSLDIPYCYVEIGEAFNGKWYVCYEKRCIHHVDSKEIAIDLAKTICYLETWHKKNNIAFTLIEKRK